VTDKAQPHLEAALALRRQVFGDHHEKVAQSLLDLGWNQHERKEDLTAEALTRQALAISNSRSSRVRQSRPRPVCKCR